MDRVEHLQWLLYTKITYFPAENIKNYTIPYLFYTLYTNTWSSMFLNPIDIFWEVNQFNHYIIKNKLVLFLA